jgi:uncharacterized membrane protein
MAFIERLIHALFVLHPMHTMVVHFPIALAGAALFFILLAIWKKNPLFEQVAFADLVLASVSVIVAGVTGMRDNINIYNGVAPNVSIKILLAILLFILTAATSFWRWKKPGLFTQKNTRWIYISAFVVAFIMVSVIGFLGGVIVYGF